VLSPEEVLVTGLTLPVELDTPAQRWIEDYYGGFGSDRAFDPLTYELADPTARLWRRGAVLARDASGRPVRRMSVYQAGVQGGGGCNMAVRRERWTSEFGFDTTLGTGTPSRGGEDIAAIVRTLWAGRKVGYEPGAVVHHRHRRTPEELRAQIEGYGTGFTATLMSLVVEDPRHLAVLAAQVPVTGARLVALARRRAGGRRWHAAPGTPTVRAYPADLPHRERLGYLRGPGAYLRSRRRLAAGAARGLAIGS
jgi:hypothetical protein